jgi:peptidoglycan/LPS O-acetylase OafA/YrhL
MPETTPIGWNSAERIPEFEGLRGCLAWWVVLFHMYLHSGLVGDRVTWIESWAPMGFTAVPLFIILSGYVIALLVETKHEPYGCFLVRRFFRLAPVYYLLTAFSVLVLWRQGTLPERLGAHVLAHLTMLHGLFPNEVLPESSIALLHPAWSISVEWQFYLLAMLLIGVGRRSPGSALGLLGACYVLSKFLLRRYGFPFEATALMRAPLFAIGIASFYATRFVVRHARLVRGCIPYMLSVTLAVAWAFRGEMFGAAILWGLILTCVLAHHAGGETWLTLPVRRFLSLRFVVFLGKVSYSTYLCHTLAMVTVANALGSSFASLTPRGKWAVDLLVVSPFILAFSWILYQYVERPGMELGRSLAARLAHPKPVAAAAMMIKGKLEVS